MKLADLIFEDYGAIASLKKYVYDAGVGFLSKSDVNELLYDYPTTKRHFAYRGLFFNSRNKFDLFIEKIKNNRIELQNYSSWTRSKSTAFQFSLTRPTNNIALLGRSFFRGEDERREKNEYTQGYGVILATAIPAGKAIDVNAVPDVGQEDELILPSGKYVVKIIKIYKPHGESVKGIVDINAWIQKQRGMRAEWEKDIDYSMMQYILKNYVDEIDLKSKKHLFRLFSGAIGRFEWRLEMQEWNDGSNRIRKLNQRSGWSGNDLSVDDYFTGKLEGKINIRTKFMNYNLIYYMPLFTPQDAEKVRAFANKKIAELIILAKKARAKYQNDYDLFFTMRGGKGLLSIADRSLVSKLNKIINADIGKVYRALNSKQTIDKINSMSGEDQGRAIQTMIDNMNNLFKKM